MRQVGSIPHSLVMLAALSVIVHLVETMYQSSLQINFSCQMHRAESGRRLDTIERLLSTSDFVTGVALVFKITSDTGHSRPGYMLLVQQDTENGDPLPQILGQGILL